MSVKTILVPIGNPERAVDSISVALTLARRLGAHVTALHIKPDAKELLPYATLGLSAKMAESVRGAAEHNSEEIAKQARELFATACEAAGVPMGEKALDAPGATASFKVESGRISTIVAERGRLADLIVSRRPDTVHPTPPQLDAMLRETGRPVLLVPPGVGEVTAKRIAIGWNCSTESASAVSAALPLLHEAEAVSVLTTKKRAAMRPNATDVIDYLGWHDVKCESRIMDTSHRSVGEALTAEASAAGADLLVIGSYSRRRLREMVMGGVTRYVLEHTSIPVLMVH